MAYKYTKGSQVIGDLKAADDAERNTLIDFGEDQIEFQTSGSTRLKVDNEGVQVTGSLDIAVSGTIKLGDVTINETELNSINGTSIHNEYENKALIRDANGLSIEGLVNGNPSFVLDVSDNTDGAVLKVRNGQSDTDGVTIIAGTGISLDGGSNFINASEINVLDSVTAGTASASRAVVMDSNIDIGGINTGSFGQINTSIVSSDSARMDIETDGLTRLIIENNEITTTVPIHISGSQTEGLRIGKAGNHYREIQFETDGVDTAFIQVDSSEGMVIGCQSVNDEIIIQTTDGGGLGEVARFTANKRLGIGETNPSEALHVSGNIRAEGNVSSSAQVQGLTGSFDVINLDRLSLTSTQTSVPPLQLTANSLSDNVGALRIDGSEPDIYLNQSGAAGFTTVTFAHGEQPMVGFGKNSAHNLYFFRETGQDGEPHTYVDTDFVFDRASGNIAIGQDLTVSGSLSFEDYIMAELSIAGLDLQTDTNAFTFNCPYNLDFERLDIYLDTASSSGTVTVTVTNLTPNPDESIFSASIISGNTSGNDSSASNASVDSGDQIRFAITAAGTGAQGLRANVRFRRRL